MQWQRAGSQSFVHFTCAPRIRSNPAFLARDPGVGSERDTGDVDGWLHVAYFRQRLEVGGSPSVSKGRNFIVIGLHVMGSMSCPAGSQTCLKLSKGRNLIVIGFHHMGQ